MSTTTVVSSPDETDPDVAWALTELAKDPITWIIVMGLIICCCGCGLLCFAYKISQIKRNNADAINAIKTKYEKDVKEASEVNEYSSTYGHGPHTVIVTDGYNTRQFSIPSTMSQQGQVNSLQAPHQHQQYVAGMSGMTGMNGMNGAGGSRYTTPSVYYNTSELMQQLNLSQNGPNGGRIPPRLNSQPSLSSPNMNAINMVNVNNGGPLGLKPGNSGLGSPNVTSMGSNSNGGLNSPMTHSGTSPRSGGNNINGGNGNLNKFGNNLLGNNQNVHAAGGGVGGVGGQGGNQLQQPSYSRNTNTDYSYNNGSVQNSDSLVNMMSGLNNNDIINAMKGGNNNNNNNTNSNPNSSNNNENSNNSGNNSNVPVQNILNNLNNPNLFNNMNNNNNTNNGNNMGNNRQNMNRNQNQNGSGSSNSNVSGSDGTKNSNNSNHNNNNNHKNNNNNTTNKQTPNPISTQNTRNTMNQNKQQSTKHQSPQQQAIPPPPKQPLPLSSQQQQQQPQQQYRDQRINTFQTTSSYRTLPPPAHPPSDFHAPPRTHQPHSPTGNNSNQQNGNNNNNNKGNPNGNGNGNASGNGNRSNLDLNRILNGNNSSMRKPRIDSTTQFSGLTDITYGDLGIQGAGGVSSVGDTMTAQTAIVHGGGRHNKEHTILSDVESNATATTTATRLRLKDKDSDNMTVISKAGVRNDEVVDINDVMSMSIQEVRRLANHHSGQSDDPRVKLAKELVERNEEYKVRLDFGGQWGATEVDIPPSTRGSVSYDRRNKAPSVMSAISNVNSQATTNMEPIPESNNSQTMSSATYL